MQLNLVVLAVLVGQVYCAVDLSRLCDRRSRSLHYLMSIRLCDRYRGGHKLPVYTSSRERDLEPTATAPAKEADKDDEKDLKDRDSDGYLRFGRSVEDPTEKSSLAKDNKDESKRYMRFGRSQEDEKRYMRFGKKSDYLRFGEERSTDNDIDNDKRYMRFGRAGEELDENSLKTEMDGDNDGEKRYMRFGRANGDDEKRYMRFGRSQDDEKRYMRFGKRYMRFGRANDDEKRYMRFGRSQEDEKRYMRFGRGQDDEKRYMRFGKRSIQKRSVDSTKEETPLERLQRLLHEERAASGGYLRFGRSDDYIRFGRYLDGNDEENKDKRFMRFGRPDYLRFGRLTDDDDTNDVNKRYMRFGRFMRFGKAIHSGPAGYLRFSRDNGLMRLSRQLAEREPAAGYLRFGRK